MRSQQSETNSSVDTHNKTQYHPRQGAKEAKIPRRDIKCYIFNVRNNIFIFETRYFAAVVWCRVYFFVRGLLTIFSRIFFF